MPLFLSEEEFRLLSHDASAVAERADAAIRDLRRQVDTIRAEADAASIAAEQTCALLEQRYEALSAEFTVLRSENVQLTSSFEQRLSEIAEAQAEKHQLHLKAIEKDGEIERISIEVSETNKSKRQLLELLEQKDAEIKEKNATIQTYFDKIVNLTDNAVEKEARLQDSEAELARLRAACNRCSQEKELLEKHNTWLNDELSSKVNNLVELRKTHMEIEAEMSAKIADFERQINESSSALKRSNERVAELELRVNSLQTELCSCKDAAAANEERFRAELATATKLTELYKERSEELSKKAAELEGVIKALEAHLSQVESEYKEKLEMESSVRKNLEKEAAELKDKLEKCKAELQTSKTNNELSLISVSCFQTDSGLEVLSIGDTENESSYNDNQMLVPKVPAGISGTALAASLLRDGWSLAKMYEKYQETADALRHEKWGRKNAEAVLERVLHEIEEKAEIILDERAEHERMVEAYTLINQKLQLALSEHDNFEITIRNLKSELKKHEREYRMAQNEIGDLQKQVSVLLKECQDIQIRCGASTQPQKDNYVTRPTCGNDQIDSSHATAENLMTFRDIKELVDQNVQLRSLVHRLTSEVETKEAELKDVFQVQLQKFTDEAKAKVETVLKKSEEQGRMIESLHSAVAMYKRLYEEERKMSASSHVSNDALPEEGRKELMLLFEGSQEVSKKTHERLAERARNLEEELGKLRGELAALRSERDKRVLEANFAKDKLDSLMKEIEHQRQEANIVSARNVELTQLLLDFQKRLRESSDSLQASEENCRKLSTELSFLKREKEILISSEKKAADEVRNLSERVHRLQSSLDTLQSTEEVRENTRAIERRKHEEHLQKVEREWAEAKKELQDERDRVRSLTHEKGKAIENSLRQVEEMRKELADAWKSVASAESRAAVAEARCSDLEAKINSLEKKATRGESKRSSLNETPDELWKVKEELERFKEESEANKNYMLQYKEIAHTNEVALKQIESAFEKYKGEAERLKESLEKEISSLRNRVSELEQGYIMKSEEAVMVTEAKEKEFSSLFAETSALRDEIAQKITQIEALEYQVSLLKEDLYKEHSKWREAQNNYERQVNLHSETIRELAETSEVLSSLNTEIVKLREVSATQKTENDILKASWEKEKMVLESLKNESERNYNELNEQNKILHNRLESLHIRLADRERGSRDASERIGSLAESDLHNVISYLRHSKEIGETEITLLKQENSRLQAQLESALKASETAQALLHSKCSRNVLFEDEEFKSLQLQVREINLLRESNVQLREENKHNFEECQKLRDEAQKAKMEAEKFENILKEKQIEFEASQKEVEKLKMEIGHLNDRISELVESHKNIDPAEYEKMKDELQQTKALLRETKAEMDLAKELASQKQETVSTLEQTLAKFQLENVELEKKLSDALQVEAAVKQEIEKHKKINSILKRKYEAEKDALNKEKQVLLKQIEDLKSSRKTAADSSNDHDSKEKDTRIQMLEKTLESKRDELRKERENKEKEKIRRLKCEKALYGILQKATEITGLPASQFPFDSNWYEYLQLADGSMSSFVDDGQGTHPILSDTGVVDAGKASEGQKAVAQQAKQSSSQLRSTDDREKESSAAKPKVEVRRAGRKLVRPRLERSHDRSEEPQSDVEKTGIEGSSMEEDKAGAAADTDLSGDNFVGNPPVSTRKRLASSTPEVKEDTTLDESNHDDVPPVKKFKDSNLVLEGNLVQNTPSSENAETADRAPLSTDVSEMLASFEDMEADQDTVLAIEEIKDASDDYINKEELGGQQKMSPHPTNNEEVHGEDDVIAEESSERSKVLVELLDEGDKGHQASAVDDDDEKEEGELLADDFEEQPEGGSNIEHQNESTSDGAGGVEDTGDSIDVASQDISTKNDNDANVDVTDKVKDQALDTSQSPQKPLKMEGSPVPPEHSSATVAETEEPRVGRTITISERAKQNALLRQARMAPQPPARGRGRGTFRRDANRGARGGRGGHG